MLCRPLDLGDSVIRVPADETASKADLMHLAAEVERLRNEIDEIVTRLRGAGAVIAGGSRPD